MRIPLPRRFRRFLRPVTPGGRRAEDLVAGPIRGDLLGADHLAERARVVARGQRLVEGRPLYHRARLLARLDDTHEVLERGFIHLSRAAVEGAEPGPAGDWLLDNYHVVQDHMQEVRSNLPREYYRELPELASGPLTGYPRVYELATTLISHTEGRIDLENVDLFVEAFQQVEPLAIGELWAVPAMLRLGLIENVRRMTLRTIERLDEVEDADRWAARIEAANESGGPALRNALRDVVSPRERLTPIFISRFLSQLRLTAGASPALLWLEHWMRDEGLRPEDATARSTQRLALTQIMMANSITSLRTIGRRDWRRFVERQSAMEAVLRTDPSGFYERMTFATRDRYRHAVERLARRSGHPETTVASWAIALATRGAELGADPRRAHVGYYLIDDGLPELEHTAGGRPPRRERLLRSIRHHPDVVLVGGLGVLTVLALVAVSILAGGEAREALPLILLFTFLPACEIGISAVNQLVTAIIPPRVLPSLNLRDGGVPAEYRTAVVVPILFGSEDDVHDALENLEVQFLANRESHLHFALLSDFTDAATEVTETDDDLLAVAAEGISALNDRYAPGGSDEFHLLHRPRRWNEQEGVWMGWERKRGKLAEFNRLLRTGSADSFSLTVGDLSQLREVRYVITLDADTMLPPDAAPALIGTMAHPLNRAVYDETMGRVVRGYGILQPRVGVSLESANQSRFAAIHAGQPGVDPYTTAVSDVYQDLYGEGSFTGKGIYDVEAFARATRGRFPANTLLSHDLIEGNYARAGLATGVIVYDDYPASYLAHARRKHRWIRGDWQLLPWLASRVPGPDGPERNKLSLLSRWKIVDNLRRSLVEVAQVALFIAGWTVLPGSPIRWTLLGLGAIAAPWVISLLLAALRPPPDKSWRAWYAAIGRDAGNSAKQFALATLFLPHQAWLSADAIMRTLYRLFVSRRHLLEWQATARVERTLAGTFAELRLAMRHTVTLVAGGAVVITAHAIMVAGAPEGTTPALWQLLVAIWPLAILWILSPFVAAALGESAMPARVPLSREGQATMRRYAAQTWRYFEQFVSAHTHWLVPDNVQVNPVEVVAMRTSPTNIGLQLLATVSAHDLGLLSIADMLDRLENTFETMSRLRRFRGHFYNWYSLDDLHVLEPAYISTVDSGNLAGHLIAFRQGCLELAARQQVDEGKDGVATLAAGTATRLDALAERAYTFVMEMDFTFLFDSSNRLFAVGYHEETHTLDSSFYDLLASEARLASFVAIARNDVPAEAWFRLGRTLTRQDGVTLMVSWSGSMFEYLMPLLVMKSLPGTLLNQSDRGAVRVQVAYGQQRGVPWGISESAYNVRDQHLTYQYRAFGVPDLALKRGLGQDLVVAPYASALAAMVMPARALANLGVLESKRGFGPYGFWDSLDYTRSAPNERFSVVQCVMAHHSGMSIVAFTNVLRHDVWQRRFHADALVRAAELLLQERVPRRVVVREAPGSMADDTVPTTAGDRLVVREIATPHTPQPRVALLGDLPYTVMLTHAGSGYSRFGDLSVTRWNADGTADDTGQYCYVRDVTRKRTWSVGHQPACALADSYHAHLAPDRVTLHRRDGAIETRTEIVVVAADNAEVRRVTLTNHSNETRELELTSYGEIVMAPGATDLAHPAFSNLFVGTQFHEWCSAITAQRRPRHAGEPSPVCVHVVDAGEHRTAPVTCETDRARFIGRGRTVRWPAALQQEGPLSGTVGTVLDPIFALRTRVQLAAGQTVSVAFTTLVAPDRDKAFALADRYHDPHTVQRALDLAWMATQIELHEMGITSAQAAVFQEIAGHLLFPGEALTPPPDELRRNAGAQPLLWSHGISGDLPILLAVIDATRGLTTLRELFAAHRYWRRRGLKIDLVIVNSHPHDYLQELRNAITEEMYAASDSTVVDQPGGVFIRRRDSFEPDEYLMLSATARVRIPCDGRSLSRIVPTTSALDSAAHIDTPETWLSAFDFGFGSDDDDRATGGALGNIVDAFWTGRTEARGASRGTDNETVKSPAPAESAPVPGNADAVVHHDNGYGRLDEENRYEIRVDNGRLPPAPWSNVIANPHGGFLVTERGAGCTWSENSFFFRLTPWHNDPVSDPVGDAIYLKDRESGHLWSATPAPVHGDGAYQVRHEPGRSVFVHDHGGVETELWVGVPEDAPVKLSLLRITNNTDRKRTLAVSAYAEWTLGVNRVETRYRVRTRYAEELRAILAQNHFDPQFAAQVAYLAATDPVTSHTTDRREFIGRHGTLADPVALRRPALGGRDGSGHDPCAALQVLVELEPGEAHEMAVLLGAAIGDDAVRETLERFDSAARVKDELERSVAAWNERLGTIEVRTPEPGFDAMLNRWTLYQALSSRLWARMGLYQSSGAYGFRDQLQDVMGIVYIDPGLARAQILRAASRQFLEGDVQHWWHPQSGRGVRTRISDDLAWLPYVADHYVTTTGDATVLDEYVPFLSMRTLAEGEDELYDQPAITDEHGSVYEHCLRALRRACTRGAHGLPLIGSGDWNDGLNRVGHEGKGESVWLAWFLITTCRAFAVHAEARGDDPAAAELRAHADHYETAVNADGSAWDGEWYRRAWYDDGTPLGSAQSDECRIDSIAQSWSVISRAGTAERSTRAMQSLNKHLVREDARLIMLLTPPFDEGTHDPGYIKGYRPGLRENGAQYTHAALWAVLATAMEGDGNRAFELFQMINPLTHASTADDVETWKVEPYVVPADVYTADGHVGRGGWTWYTGSASWMYRVGLESILGFTRRGDRLTIQPRVPASWPSYSITYRYGRSVYSITVERPARVAERGGIVTVDGVGIDDGVVRLVDDGAGHDVLVVAG
ncbi:MAG TPA: glucoamylase family protein [Gemmatimonadaceae bacterium]|nr:glucoamylase family protein [Gemmatimonadaceae bacterium]